MKHNPADDKWADRDRFVLSSGHGSMLLYSLLHLFGYGLTIEDLKQFRQFGSKTPGHPEYGHTRGVETSTGPLGMGISNAVGMAMAESYLAAKFNREGFPIVDHNTYVILGDGCMMEGLSHEACSLAGTLKLNKLIALYDDNEISIEGSTDIAFREDVQARFRAYGWNVIDVADANVFENVDAAIKLAKISDKPTLIACHTTIGYGSPKAGMASAHGEPLGEENIVALKKNLGWIDDVPMSFAVPAEVYETTAAVAEKGAKAEKAWNEMFEAWSKAYPELRKEWDVWHSDELPGRPSEGRGILGVRRQGRHAQFLRRVREPSGRAHPEPHRRQRRPGALQQDLHEGRGRLLRREPHRPQPALRRSRARDGLHLRRHEAARRPAPVLRHVLRVLRFYEERHARGGDHEAAGHLRAHARLHRRGRGRPHPSARGAARRVCAPFPAWSCSVPATARRSPPAGMPR